MSNKRKSYNKLSKARSELAMEMLLSGEKTLQQIAAELDVPLRTIADWAMRPSTMRRAFSLARLHNARTALLVGSIRPNVSVSLFDLAKSNKGGETARKACIDLLKLDLSKQGAEATSSNGDDGNGNAPTRHLREHAVLRAFELLGGLTTEKEAYRP